MLLNMYLFCNFDEKLCHHYKNHLAQHFHSTCMKHKHAQEHVVTRVLYFVVNYKLDLLSLKITEPNNIHIQVRL